MLYYCYYLAKERENNTKRPRGCLGQTRGSAVFRNKSAHAQYDNDNIIIIIIIIYYYIHTVRLPRVYCGNHENV